MTALLAFPEKTNRNYLEFLDSAGVSRRPFSMRSHRKASIALKATSGRRYPVGTFVRKSDEA